MVQCEAELSAASRAAGAIGSRCRISRRTSGRAGRMPASGSRPWTGAGVTTRAGRRRSSIAWSAVEHDGPWPQLGQEPQSPKSDWWTRVEGVGDRLIGGRGGDAGFLSDGAPRSSALPLVVAFACKASLTSQISRRVTPRMKHDFSMYSFISRFYIVALAFNSYSKLCSLLQHKMQFHIHTR
jgi:hypothetical protein